MFANGLCDMPKSTSLWVIGRNLTNWTNFAKQNLCMCAEECYTEYDICVPIFNHVGIVCQIENKWYPVWRALFLLACWLMKDRSWVATGDWVRKARVSIFGQSSSFSRGPLPVWHPSGGDEHNGFMLIVRRDTMVQCAASSYFSLRKKTVRTSNCLRFSCVIYVSLECMTCVIQL